ncbi:hypothetical protein GUJ93_ZPchr0002g26193 [Zizania palustris]|uniref:Uncharacterized protein n=1 Tax=Zizania palustris TaxID=103762 RepID=A0A8J5VE95_ZIZPA|nr:hypothetical protein GUJ93_ZPchr0002g26193 [Zizania palustris]
MRLGILGALSYPSTNEDATANKGSRNGERERKSSDLGVGGAQLRRRQRRGRGAGQRAGRVDVEGLEEEEHAAERHSNRQWAVGSGSDGGASQLPCLA